MTTLLWVDPSNLVFNLQGTLTNRQVKYLPSGSFELTLIFGDVRIESTSIGAAQAAPFYGQCFLLPSLRLLGEVKTISFSCRLGTQFLMPLWPNWWLSQRTQTF